MSFHLVDSLTDLFLFDLSHEHHKVNSFSNQSLDFILEHFSKLSGIESKEA